MRVNFWHVKTTHQYIPSVSVRTSQKFSNARVDLGCFNKSKSCSERCYFMKKNQKNGECVQTAPSTCTKRLHKPKLSWSVYWRGVSTLNESSCSRIYGCYAKKSSQVRWWNWIWHRRLSNKTISKLSFYCYAENIFPSNRCNIVKDTAFKRVKLLTNIY